jgi:poly-gamma-glutamate capsule biosynthesis protein CapA/YwtB (metallophosphatase superfamily)
MAPYCWAAMKRVPALLLCAAMILPACSFGPQRSTRLDVNEPVVVLLRDEAGDPIGSASYEFGGVSHEADASGRIEIAINGPVAGVVTAEGMLPEPVVVSPRDGQVTVTLLAREGPDGPRSVVHFGGDVMLGRRYQEPTRLGTALAGSDSGARSVVSDLGVISSAADATIVNAETVIGELPEDQAYDGKRFLLQSPPSILAALDELGVDLVTLGNNHAYDWRDAGVRSTLDVLDGAGMPHAGSGLTAADAVRGALITAGSRQIGIISVTTVDGDFVNDSLPPGDEAIPSDLSVGDAWQYDARVFGFGAVGDAAFIPTAERRPRDAWDAYRAIEPDLTAEADAALWTALTAEDAYPELQDWVARRGHGGAAAYDREQVAAEIERLRSDGADTVVVQFHAGFQFAVVKSAFVRQISHDAIDDGADMVISHHPHVLQGVEWYQGRLIAYSLGNLVFDQDFLATFPSALLRVVIDDTGVVQARLLPVMLVGYRPVPVAGDAAERIVRLLDTRSALPAESERIAGFSVGGVLLDEVIAGIQRATVSFDRNSGLIQRGRVEEQIAMQAGPIESASVPPCLALRADQLPDGVEYGVDLFGWGRFDDMTADAERGSPMHWVTPDDVDNWDMTQGSSPDPTDDALQLATNANRPVLTRFVARSTLAAHRIYDSDTGNPADGVPAYTLEFDARTNRAEGVTIRLDVFYVDASDPTSDPTSGLLRTVDIPVDTGPSEEWQGMVIPIDPSVFASSDTATADAVMVTIIAEPSFRGTVAIDNFRLLEWRPAPQTHLPLWTEVDALRAAETERFEVTVSGCRNV